MTRLSRYQVDQMAALHEAAFASGWTEQDFIENIHNELDDVLGLVDVDEAGVDHLCGFILTRTLEDQSEILTIVVDPERRVCGLGRALLKAGERTAKCRGADIMFLEVGKDNPGAVALYEKSGYQRCGTRKGYYRRAHGRVDALLFQKKL